MGRIQYGLLLAFLSLALISGCNLPTTAPPASLPSDLDPGDTLSYVVYNNQDEITARYESSLADDSGANAWVVETTIHSASGPAQQITYTAQVDLETGLVTSSRYRAVYASPQTNTFAGEALRIQEFWNLRDYDLEQDTMHETQRALDDGGQWHATQASSPADYAIFQIPGQVQPGEYIPWETGAFPRQVVESQRIEVPAGRFQTWAVKHIVSPENRYTLEYYDQASGLLVKSENWARQGEKWVVIEETRLASFVSGPP